MRGFYGTKWCVIVPVMWKTRQDLTNLHCNVMNAIDPGVCNTIIGIHTFSWCKLCVRETLAQLGDSWDVSPELQTKLQEDVRW